MTGEFVKLRDCQFGETMKRWIVLALGVAWISGFSAPRAQAHPHVWVTYQATFTYDNGAVTGVDHTWTFDEMYTTMAIEGLDKNGDGTYSREELAELAQTNMDGLKDFGYFTAAQLAGKDLQFGPPRDYWLEHSNGILKLHFKLPLATAVPADAAGLSFAIYDPTYFIAFEPEKDGALKLAGAPQGCAAAFAAPDAALSPKPGDGTPLPADGLNLANVKTLTVAITCKKS